MNARLQRHASKIPLGNYESDVCHGKLNVKYAIIILWLGRHLERKDSAEFMSKIKVNLAHATGNKILDGAHYP